jgi:hypothetical protein
MPKYDFPNGTPWPLMVAYAFTAVNIVGWFATGIWADYFVPRQPGSHYSFPNHSKGGITFVSSLVEHYLQWGLWIHFMLLGILALMICHYVRNGRAVRVL